MVGRRAGMLSVISDAGNYVRPNGKKAAKFLCRCDCGNTVVVLGSHLRNGGTKSCGCLKRLRPSRLTHGHGRKNKQTRTYKSWAEMIARCDNPKSKIYPYYGGRGITVCERWRSFEHFLADMGERSEGTSLDRIDNDGNYEPGNCRWATKKEQARNRRSNRIVTYRGKEMSLVEAAERAGLNPMIVATRLHRGWSEERALTEALRK